MSEPKRAIVVNPATNEVENVILVDPDSPFSLPGKLIVDDQWGAGPGHLWDPAQQRPFEPVRTIGDPENPVQVLMDQKRAVVERNRDELEQALISGQIDAAMEIIARVHRALRELEQLGPDAVP